MLNYKRYKRNPVLHYPQRQWPDKEIEKAPIWCSVDLRDGNQALIEPMNVAEKMEMFELLLKLGFKEIEIGFPAASQIEYDFLRELVRKNKIPDDVKVQVLTQCRKELIDRTFEAIEGIKNVVVHIYNSTSTLQRDVVFHKSQDEIIDIAGFRRQCAVGIFAGEFYRNRSRLRAADLYGGTEGVGSRDGCADHLQPARHGGNEHAERIRGSDRMDEHAF